MVWRRGDLPCDDLGVDLDLATGDLDLAEVLDAGRCRVSEREVDLFSVLEDAFKGRVSMLEKLMSSESSA